MTTLEQFAKYFDITEQLTCWPDTSRYTGDPSAFQAWLNESTAPSAAETQLLDALHREAIAAPPNHEYYETETTSGSVTLFLLRLPSGRVIVGDTVQNRYAFTAAQFAALPAVVYEEVEQDDTAE